MDSVVREQVKEGSRLVDQCGSEQQIDIQQLAPVVTAAMKEWRQGHEVEQCEVTKRAEILHAEETKRAQFQTQTIKTQLRGFFAVALAVLAISVIALFLGKDQMAEKIIIGVMGFIGGLGFGKTYQSKQS